MIPNYKKYIELIIIIGAVLGLIFFGLHFYNPFSNLFGKQQPIRVENTSEYKNLELKYETERQEKEDAKKKAAYYEGLHDQAIKDVNELLDKLPKVNQTYNNSVKTVKKMTHVEIDFNYQNEVKQQEKEMQIIK